MKSGMGLQLHLQTEYIYIFTQFVSVIADWMWLDKKTGLFLELFS